MQCGCSPESHRQHLDAWKVSGIVDVVMKIGGFQTFHPCGAFNSSSLTECRQCGKMLVFKSFIVELLYRKQEIVDKEQGQEQQGECRLCGRIPAWVAMEKGDIEKDEEFKSIELEVVRHSPTDHQTRTDLILKYDRFKPSLVVPLCDPTTPTSTTSGTLTPTPTPAFDTTASVPLVNVATIVTPNATTTTPTNTATSNHKRKTLANPKKEQKRARLSSTPVDFYGEFQMSSVMVAESVLEAVKNKRSNITYRVFNRNKKTDSILSLSDDRKTWRILCLVEDDQLIVKETFDFSRGIVALERIVTRGVIRVEGIKIHVTMACNATFSAGVPYPGNQPGHRGTLLAFL
eukprot:GILJ01012011.1.p1 GENE.GILJ01012011.1~~GILJ01012011.1.p1  ORF type:complete len:346 (+),score=37.39 GILJ01012011.1:2-1039(+)